MNSKAASAARTAIRATRRAVKRIGHANPNCTLIDEDLSDARYFQGAADAYGEGHRSRRRRLAVVIQKAERQFRDVCGLPRRVRA